MSKNWLHIRTGRYSLTEHVHFDVSGNEAGIVISLHDLERKVAYWIDVRDGKVNFGDITDYVAKRKAAEPRTVRGRLKVELSPEGYLPETGVEFVVEFPSTPLPPRRLRVLGGYHRREEVRVIYREVTAGIFMDRIGKLRSPGEIILNMRRGPACLLPSDWLRFGALPSHASFKLGRRRWQKMSVEQLGELLGDKSFRSFL